MPNRQDMQGRHFKGFYSYRIREAKRKEAEKRQEERRYREWISSSIMNTIDYDLAEPIERDC